METIPGLILIFVANLFFVTRSSAGELAVLSSYIDVDRTFDDVLFTENVMFTVNARSKLDCSNYCVNTKNCTSFTYHQSGFVTSCRGYAKTMTSNSSTSQVMGAKTFRMKGPRCPVSSGFVQDSVTGLCYKALQDRYNYTAARAVCQAMDSDFIMLDTEDRVQALLRGGQILPQGGYWMGLRRPEHLGPTTSNTSASEYAWTRTGQFVDTVNYFYPSLAFGANCTACAILPGDNFMWLVFPCEGNYQNRILCEKL